MSAYGENTKTIFDQGRTFERNRILNLLVESQNINGWVEWDSTELIAAIKGENNE
jgi:NADH:ubiquinone oxidoreductase subunit E